MSLVLCQKNSYLKKWKSTVKECIPILENKNQRKFFLGGFLLILEETILFPEGGGQPCDFGTINGIKVLDVFRDEKGQVVHQIEKNIEPFSIVEIEIDWDRRYDHMQQHTAQHLISAIMKEHFQANTTSWNLGNDFCTIDFDIKEFHINQLQKLEELVNNIIMESIPIEYIIIDGKDLSKLPEKVKSRGIPKDIDFIRLVEIKGIDMNTCCGTHVKNTNELRMIKFIGIEKNKGCVRILFLAGNRISTTLSKYIEKEKELNKILNGGSEEHILLISKIQQELHEISKINKHLLKELANLIADKLAKSDKKFEIFHKEYVTMEFFQIISNIIQQKNPNLIVFLSNELNNGEGQFMLIGPPSFIESYGKKICEIMEGKGGGKKVLQGKTSKIKNRSKILPFLNSIFNENNLENK